MPYTGLQEFQVFHYLQLLQLVPLEGQVVFSSDCLEASEVLFQAKLLYWGVPEQDLFLEQV